MEWLGRKLVPLTKERSMPMGMADTVTKAYMRKNNIFADAFNYLIYEGKPVVDPKQLRELDTTEIALPFGSQEKENGQSNDLVQKYREYSCAMKSHFRKFRNQMSGSGNYLCNYASLLA